MNVFAYCTAPARPAVAKAVGMKPFTSPPWSAVTFTPQWLEDRDFIYFRLHQIAGMPYVWLGENSEGDMAPAMRVEHLQDLDLSGATVLIANCYSADSPFVPALYAARAGAVIAAPGPNFAAGDRVIGADLLASWLIRGLRWRLDVRRALQLAKARLLTTAWRASDRDALAFQIMEPQNGAGSAIA